MSTSESSTKSSTQTPPQQKAVRHLWTMGRLKQMAGMIGLSSLQSEAVEQQKNRRAENQAVRQAMWGNDGAAAGGEDDMNQFIIAENMTSTQNPAPAPQPKASLLPLALAGLAAFGIPTTAGVLMAPQIIEALHPPPAVIEAEPLPDHEPLLLPGKPGDASE